MAKGNQSFVFLAPLLGGVFPFSFFYFSHVTLIYFITIAYCAHAQILKILFLSIKIK